MSKDKKQIYNPCPKCGSELEMGFGLAGGGYGPYEYCIKRQTMKRTAWFDIACNDPDNGLFAGRANMIHYRWGNEYIELEADCWDGFTFSEGDDWLRLHRRKFRFIESKGWVGNWCWDGYRMKRSEAKRFLGMLRASGRWSCVQGPTRWFEWFNGPEPAHHDAQIPNDAPGKNYA